MQELLSIPSLGIRKENHSLGHISLLDDDVPDKAARILGVTPNRLPQTAPPKAQSILCMLCLGLYQTVYGFVVRIYIIANCIYLYIYIYGDLYLKLLYSYMRLGSPVQTDAEDSASERMSQASSLRSPLTDVYVGEGTPLLHNSSSMPSLLARTRSNEYM